MPIDPAQLVRGLAALDTIDLEGGLARPLRQVLWSAKTLLDADMAGVMLVDRAGGLRWASASDPVETHEGELELADGPCRAAFAARLSVPVDVGGGPVGTLDVYVTSAREWDDSEAAALQAHAGLVASVFAAGVRRGVTGRLADQLQGALEHRLLIQQAVEAIADREDLDAQAALEWLGTAARSSGWAPVQMARAVLAGAPLPSDLLVEARARRREATDLAVAGHRRDSDLHEGAARRYERRGQAGRAQTERLQAAAARGRIIDAEAERRRADRDP